MITCADAISAIDALGLPRRTISVPIAQALGRTLAREVCLARDQPGFDRATMDGYAVALDGSANRFHVIATIAAGASHAGAVLPGQAVRIMTGAPCPPGITVIPHERTDRGDPFVIVEAGALIPGRNIARRGEDGRAGDVVLAAGTTMSPIAIASAAMAGAERVDVCDPPTLAAIITGDEVGGGGPAGIADSNGPFLSAFAAAMGLPLQPRRSDDDGQTLMAALTAATAGADITITTGGVSAGDRDLVVPSAAALGFRTIFHHVAMQPGKPVLFAERDGRFLIGLPGNPVAVVVTAHLFLARLIAGFGATAAAPTWQTLPLACPWQHPGNRQLFLPARVDHGRVTPLRWNGSGDLLAAAAGDGLVDLPPASRFAAGDAVPFMPYIGSVPGRRGSLPPRQRP